MTTETDYSLQNGQWIERKPMPELTEEQQAILNEPPTESGQSEQQIALMEWIAAQVKQPASESVIPELQAIFNANAIDGAEVIDAHITLPDGRGIINCRSAGEHKQIRF